MLNVIDCVKKLKFMGVASLYIILSICFGEWHPFSKFPMYSSLPNWSYSFYITSLNNKLIPTVAFHTNSGELGHMYGGICEKYKIAYGDGAETKEQLKFIGESLFKTIANDPRNKVLVKNGIIIHRIYFFFSKGTVHSVDDIMYEYTNQ